MASANGHAAAVSLLITLGSNPEAATTEVQ